MKGNTKQDSVYDKHSAWNIFTGFFLGASPVLAVGEQGPFAAVVFQFVRLPAFSVHRGQPGAAPVSWSAGWS